MTELRPAAAKFARFTAAVHRLLPGFLKFIPVTFIGFTLISSFTFSVDLVLLWLTHSVWNILYPVAVSVSFGAAAMLAFFLNKILNFRVRGDMGKQSAKYVAVLISNYVIWILLFSSILEAVGVHYQVARISAALAEGIYIYLLSRIWVFARH